MKISYLVIIISLILNSIFLFFIILFIKKASAIKNLIIPREINQLEKDKFKTKWQGLLKSLESSQENDWKFAIIEADNLIDEILKINGYKGKTLSDRLKSLKKSGFKNIDCLWQAHKIRNKIVHERKFKIQLNEVKNIIDFYRIALVELKILD